MHPTRLDTAILLFSRSAAEESVSKPLVESTTKAKKAVATQLINNARRVADRSSLPVFFISGNQQHGVHFGERFADAFEQLFAKGFKRVISIGNDCPALKTQDLLDAAKQLDTASCVFGPASDGGVYLIGIRFEIYGRASFLQIAWQTPMVFEALKVYAGGDFVCLDEKSDVDSPADLVRVLKIGNIAILLKIRLLNCLKCYFSSIPYWLNSEAAMIFMGCNALRGPPRFIVVARQQ